MYTSSKFGKWHFAPSLAIFLFMLFGTVLIITAFFAFSRAYDHSYFLDLANQGVPAATLSGIDFYDLKAQAIAAVFYILATPSRILGGSDLGHIVWLRVLSLVGVLMGFEWVLQVAGMKLDSKAVKRARNRFLLLFLLYPGQIAWSSSLLRDAPACALLFAGLYGWSCKQRFVSLVCMFGGIALRPEFLVVIVIVSSSFYFVTKFRIEAHRRKYWLLGLLIFVSLAAFEHRSAVSAFSQLAFEEAGAAYPTVGHLLDIPGYLLVFIQGAIDPIPLADLGSATPFFVLECAFYIWLLIIGYRRLPKVNFQIAGLIIGTLISMWIFAYFEIYVSGFARHRMVLTVMLIALVALPVRATEISKN